MDVSMMHEVACTLELNLHAQNDQLEGLDIIEYSLNLVEKELSLGCNVKL